MVASYPLSSQAPTPVEVELGCDNYKEGKYDDYSLGVFLGWPVWDVLLNPRFNRVLEL